MKSRRRTILLAAVPLLLFGLVLGVREASRHFSWDNFGVVEEGRIYRSGRLRSPQLRDAIERYGLRTVVNLSANEGRPETAEEEALVRGSGLTYVGKNWPGDGVVPPERLRWVADLLSDPANQPVLVHCARGAQRTGAAVASYRILKEGWTLDRVLEEMERYRFRPERNPGLARRIEEVARSATAARDG